MLVGWLLQRKVNGAAEAMTNPRETPGYIYPSAAMLAAQLIVRGPAG